MKKVLLTIVFAVLTMSTAIFAQERIAVFPFEDMENILTRNESFMFYDEFSNEFTNRSVGRFSVVPRQDVDRLIDTEYNFQLHSKFSEKEKTAEYERVLNGSQILSGRIGKLENNIRITVSLFTYPDLVRLPGGVTISVSNKSELFSKIPEIVQSMQNEIVSNLPKPLPPLVGKWKAKNSNLIMEFRSDGTFFGTGYESKTATGYWESDNRLSSGKYEAILKNTYDGGGGIAKEEYKLVKGTISGTYTFTSSIISMSYNISGSLETQSLKRETRSYGSSYGEQISTTSHSDQGNFSIPYTISQDGKTLTIGQHPVFLKSVKNNYAPQPAIYYSEFLKE